MLCKKNYSRALFSLIFSSWEKFSSLFSTAAWKQKQVYSFLSSWFTLCDVKLLLGERESAFCSLTRILFTCCWYFSWAEKRGQSASLLFQHKVKASWHRLEKGGVFVENLVPRWFPRSVISIDGQCFVVFRNQQERQKGGHWFGESCGITFFRYFRTPVADWFSEE